MLIVPSPRLVFLCAVRGLVSRRNAAFVIGRPQSSRRLLLRRRRHAARGRRGRAGTGCTNGRGAWSRAARIVPVGHAFLQERGARGTEQLLIVGAELARRHFLFCSDRKRRTARQHRDQDGDRKRVSMHGFIPWLSRAAILAPF